MRFNHVLFANDFSHHSLALTGEVEWLANRFLSKLTVMHVLEVPATWYAGVDYGISGLNPLSELAAVAQKRLQEFPISVPEDRVRRIFSQGDVARQIADYAAENQVDLIVLGTHGHGPVRSLLGGSVLGKVLHDVNCAVWTTAYRDGVCSYTPAISKILCELEINEEAVPLLQAVTDLAASFSAQVRLVHAVPDAETRPNKYFDFDLHRYLMEGARVEIARLQRAAGTDFPVTVGSTSIAKTIADTASEYGCDLVVIGRGKARSPLGRFRTNAYDIIRNVTCPVLSCAVDRERTSSSCSEEHHDQYATGAQPRTGCLKP